MTKRPNKARMKYMQEHYNDGFAAGWKAALGFVVKMSESSGQKIDPATKKMMESLPNPMEYGVALTDLLKAAAGEKPQRTK